MSLHDKAVEIEKNACRNRWLVVKLLLSKLSSYERDEVLQMIKVESKRITDDQISNIQTIIDADDSGTLGPL